MKIDKTGIEERYNAAGVLVRYEVRAHVGSGDNLLKDSASFPPGTPFPRMAKWRIDALVKLQRQRGAKAGTFGGDVARYLKDAPITEETRTRRKQQLAFWSAQAAAIDAPVLSVADVRAGRRVPDEPTIGEQSRDNLTAPRVRQILAAAFKPTSEANDPTEFAGTSNHYRTALYHLYTVLDRDNDARNPIDKIEPRTMPAPARVGQDMRIVARILAAIPTKYGRLNRLGEKRAAVLAYCPITPVQLQRMKPEHFRDVPDATRDQIINGAIAIELAPRRKGRRKKLPAPTLEPLTPYGVAAMRALVATPGAFAPARQPGRPPWSVSMLNKAFKGARDRAIAALAAEGIAVDTRCQEMTLYVLKHSLTAAMSRASGGRVDARTGEIAISKGVQTMLGHSSERMTKVYSLGAVDPILVEVNAATSRFLDQLFAEPLGGTPVAPPALRLVGTR